MHDPGNLGQAPGPRELGRGRPSTSGASTAPSSTRRSSTSGKQPRTSRLNMPSSIQAAVAASTPRPTRSRPAQMWRSSAHELAPEPMARSDQPPAHLVVGRARGGRARGGEVPEAGDHLAPGRGLEGRPAPSSSSCSSQSTAHSSIGRAWGAGVARPSARRQTSGMRPTGDSSGRATGSAPGWGLATVTCWPPRSTVMASQIRVDPSGSGASRSGASSSNQGGSHPSGSARNRPPVEDRTPWVRPRASTPMADHDAGARNPKSSRTGSSPSSRSRSISAVSGSEPMTPMASGRVATLRIGAGGVGRHAARQDRFEQRGHLESVEARPVVGAAVGGHGDLLVAAADGGSCTGDHQEDREPAPIMVGGYDNGKGGGRSQPSAIGR